MVVDLFLVYQFIRRLATPFNKWEAFKLGIIDANGKVLIKRKDFSNSQQSKAWGIFDIMIANLKKLLGKVPGGSSRLASYAAALFLIKEYKAFTDESMLTEDMSEEDLEESLLLFNDRYVNYIKEESDVKALLTEKLKKSDDMGTWIKDFYDSDVPQFKGKSKAKRRSMAVAAKLDAMDEAVKKVPPPRWKRAGSDGEIEATIGGKKYKIEKASDHNERHKGEWKVMVWDKRDWEWETTEYGKANAKAWIMDRLKEETIEEDGPCWDSHKQVGMKKKGNRLVPNCVPKNEDVPANNVGSGNIAGMDGGHMSKSAQKKWTASNKSKKKRLRDIMGAPK